MTIQAPSKALVVATMSRTTPVTSAPNPLIAALERQPWPPTRRQCITIPACDNVNDTNTPIM